MSKSLKYVKDFEFPSDCGFTGSAGSQMVKGYARGGAAKTPAAPKSERKEMARVMRETSSERKGAGAEVKRVSREESYDQAKVSSPAKPARKAYPAHSDVPMIAMNNGGMIKNRGTLGVVNNKNPGETKKHTAPDLAKPKTMMKSGGSVKKMAVGGLNQMRQRVETAMPRPGMGGGPKTATGPAGPIDPRTGRPVGVQVSKPPGFDGMGGGQQVPMQRGQPQVGRMPGNAMTRDQQMQQAQQMQQTNRPADMGMRQQVAQQMAQAQMQAQQQMAQQRPQVPMQQAQPMKKGGMTYKKK